MTTKGVIYTAGGDYLFVKEALFSAKTLKKHNPKLKTALFTTFKDVRSRYFDFIFYQDPTMHPMKQKVANMLESPFDYTLYLDTDTQVVAPIYEIFDFLMIYDLGFTHRVKAKWGKRTVLLDYIDFDTIQTGFLLYRKNEKVEKFLQIWRDEMMKNKDSEIKSGLPTGDQATLNRLIKTTNLLEQLQLSYVFFPNKVYNARPWLWAQAKKDGEWKQIKIFHAHNLNKTLPEKIKTMFIKAKHKIPKYRKN